MGGVEADMKSTVAPDSPLRPTAVVVLTESQRSHQLVAGVATSHAGSPLPNLQGNDYLQKSCD